MSVKSVIDNYVNEVTAAGKKPAAASKPAGKQPYKTDKAKADLKALKAKLAKLKAMKSVQEYIKVQKAVDKASGVKTTAPRSTSGGGGNSSRGYFRGRIPSDRKGIIEYNKEVDKAIKAGKWAPKKLRVPPEKPANYVHPNGKVGSLTKPAGSKKK